MYKTARWRHLREVKLNDNPLCECCMKQGEYKPAEAVHHIIPISEGGDPWDLNNLESLCEVCHNRLSGGKNV